MDYGNVNEKSLNWSSNQKCCQIRSFELHFWGNMDSQLMLRGQSEKISFFSTRGLLALHLRTFPICFILGVNCRMLSVTLPSTDDVSWLPSEIRNKIFRTGKFNLFFIHKLSSEGLINLPPSLPNLMLSMSKEFLWKKIRE